MRSTARRKESRRRRGRTTGAPTDRETTITLTVNGTAHVRTLQPRVLLVDFLRDHLRLTGTHIGCDTSHCGACTVLLDGHAVKACTMFAVQADGSDITTIEGLEAHGRMHPVQEAFKEHHGLQCGFCTPGVVMAAVDLLNRNKHPSEPEIRTAISGNLCRCTGYVKIVESIAAVTREAAADGGK